ncbi:MAG: protein kinase domain-containing protein, partial [bacterium]
MIGKIVSHYRILEKIADGGMGEVYKAQDIKLGRCAALKFLKTDLEAKPEEKHRFVQEAIATSARDHNNICTIYEIGETNEGRMFIAMAYYEGGSLKDRISRGRMPLAEAVDMAIQIAQGLAKAHEGGIVHRDIKPANVMLTNDGVAKIVDFGLAILADATRLSEPNAVVGTPTYMSPEQAMPFDSKLANRLDVDHRTDIWSLGVVLYELLSAQTPFTGENYLAVMYAIVNLDPEPLQKHVPGLPPELLHIVERALKKSAVERYPSVNDILLELRELKKKLPNDGEGSEVVVIPGRDSDIAKKLRQLIKQTLSFPDIPEPAAEDNPYLNRVRIRNPREFYGRSSELSRIYERIKAGRPQSVSVVGARRIGKSSLLSAIHHPANRIRYLPAPQEYVFVLMDFQEKRNVAPAELLNHIGGALKNEFHGQLNGQPDYEGLMEAVHTFQEAGLKLIFLWDEFESVTRNPHIGPEFYAYFRALANNYNVAYITTSSAQLQTLCHTKAIADSPFFNIFTNLHLGSFKPEEARQLIAEPSAKAGKSLASHAD